MSKQDGAGGDKVVDLDWIDSPLHRFVTLTVITLVSFMIGMQYGVDRTNSVYEDKMMHPKYDLNGSGVWGNLSILPNGTVYDWTADFRVRSE